MDIKETFKSNKFKTTTYIVLAVLILLVTFQFGMMTGYKKATFSDKVGRNYFMQMQGMRDRNFMGIKPGDFMGAHGATGKIISINLPNIVIENIDGTTKTFLISSSTEIKYTNDTKKSTDLKVDDIVVTFGTPNKENTVIEAKLIRIMPPIDANQAPKNN